MKFSVLHKHFTLFTLWTWFRHHHLHFYCWDIFKKWLCACFITGSYSQGVTLEPHEPVSTFDCLGNESHLSQCSKNSCDSTNKASQVFCQEPCKTVLMFSPGGSWIFHYQYIIFILLLGHLCNRTLNYTHTYIIYFGRINARNCGEVYSLSYI